MLILKSDKAKSHHYPTFLFKSRKMQIDVVKPRVYKYISH